MSARHLAARASPRVRHRLPALLLSLAVTWTASGCAGAPDPSIRAGDGATSDVEVEADVAYRDVDGTTLSADVCHPATTATPRPAVLLLHGGGFDGGDKTDVRGLCERLAEQGIVGVAVEYRLAPEVYPAQVDDAAAALDWLALPATARRFGVDPARIGVLGTSAGAIIAESVGVGMGGASTPVRVVVSLSGASDFTEAAAADASPRSTRLALGYLGCTTVEDCPTAEEASPVLRVTAQSPPMLLVIGSDELIPVEQGQVMADALTAAGVANQLLVVDGSDHGLALLGPATLTTVSDFLATHL